MDTSVPCLVIRFDIGSVEHQVSATREVIILKRFASDSCVVSTAICVFVVCRYHTYVL
jgi:hypothetical protein